MHIWEKGRATDRVWSGQTFCRQSRVGSSQRFAGSGRVGFKESDPWTTLMYIINMANGDAYLYIETNEKRTVIKPKTIQT